MATGEYILSNMLHSDKVIELQRLTKLPNLRFHEIRISSKNSFQYFNTFLS